LEKLILVIELCYLFVSFYAGFDMKDNLAYNHKINENISLFQGKYASILSRHIHFRDAIHVKAGILDASTTKFKPICENFFNSHSEIAKCKHAKTYLRIYLETHP